MNIKNSEAVKIEGCRVSLELTWSAGDASDTIIFRENIGGQLDLTEAQAIEQVMALASAWAINERNQGTDVCVWDDAGNHY